MKEAKLQDFSAAVSQAENGDTIAFGSSLKQ